MFDGDNALYLRKSCKTPENNSVNEEDIKTARTKYNLVGFSAVLCKRTTANERFVSFIENAAVQCLIFFGEFEDK